MHSWTARPVVTEPMYLSSGTNASKPRFENVRAIMQKTPMGANFMTRFVISIMRSLAWVRKFAMTEPRSFIFASRMPTSSANRMTWSMVPCAREAKGFSGMMLRMVSTAEVLSATVTSLPAMDDMSRPMPGRMTSAVIIATVTASAVVQR